jgi:hypothetical protein
MSGEMTGLKMGEIKKEGMEEQQRRRIYGDVVIKHLNMSHLQEVMATKDT